MALEVEDGTGKANAEAYISVADADTYFSDRGYTLWATLSTPEKEQALRRSTDYMEAVYGPQWLGEKSTTTQALSWPRTGTDYASDLIPRPVARANAELAFRAASGELAPDLGAQVKQETVGPISVTYADGARQQVRFQAVDAMLQGLLNGSAGMIKLVRG